MLRSFRLGNHRSFRDEQELLLMPAYSKDRLALPVAAIYGANASGKSNLLGGLQFMADAVRDSFGKWMPDGGVPRQPFKLDPDARSEPSLFVAELIVDGVRYTYGFVVDDDRVLEEWLYSYPEKRKRVLFDRNGDDLKFGSTVSERATLDGVAEMLLRPNALLLSLMGQLKLPFIASIHRWFSRRLVFRLDIESSIDDEGIGDFVRSNKDLRGRLAGLLRVADLGISEVVVTVITEDAESVKQRVQLRHGPDVEPFDLDDESAGTRSWLGLLPSVLTALRDGGTLVIDEIDASLHPLLAARLIGLFRDTEVNAAGGQLIFTTHDATLLHPPLLDEVLDRDEVWFVEKDAGGKSSLYPLTDFKPRSEDNLERRYLAGRYGAVPELFEEDFASAVRSLATHVEG